ncbi:MAG: thioredoxin [Verrucomicrobiota bacterium]
MASNKIITLTEASFPQEVLQSPIPVVVDFWAEWCGPCKMLTPILDELADEFEGRVKIGKLNIDDHQGVAGQYGITSIPTMLFFKGGEVAGQVVGLRSKNDIKASFAKLSS